MKFLACAVFLGAAMGLQATPVCLTTGDHATLQSLGSCTVGDKTFSDFTGTVGVLKDVNVVGGSGFASISQFPDTVSQSSIPDPEPGFYGVLAGGLGAVLMFARRRKKSA